MPLTAAIRNGNPSKAEQGKPEGASGGPEGGSFTAGLGFVWELLLSRSWEQGTAGFVCKLILNDTNSKHALADQKGAVTDRKGAAAGQD